MAPILTNNATSALDAGISDSATSLSVTAGDAGLFPAPSGGQWFPITVFDTAGNMEIMRCTARSGAALTVVRAQEGTTASAFDAGARVEVRFTSAVLADVMASLNLRTPYQNRASNPAMQISQRRGAATVDVAGGIVFVVDRWAFALSGTPGGTLRGQQIINATPGGSPFRLRATVQVADTSLAAGDLYSIYQPAEGFIVADARFGSASARQIILRMGIRSSVAGTFGVRIANNNADRSWIGLITVSAGEVNTDIVRTLVIPGDTTGAWDSTTGRGLLLQITLASGTTWMGAAGWSGANINTTSAQTNFMATSGATFDLFDVGLYVDHLNTGVPPAFEVPDFGEDLAHCQRYFCETRASVRGPAATGGEVFETHVYWPVTMRTAPNVNLTSGGIRNNIASGWPQIQSAATSGARMIIVSNAAGDTYAANDIVTADAEF